MMNEELLKKFVAKTEPYRRLWKSLRLVCFGARHGETWVAVALRVSLSELPPGRSEYLRPIDDFIAVSTYRSVDFLDQLLREIIIEGFVSIELDSISAKVCLTRELAGLPRGQVGQVSWFGVVENERRDHHWDYGSQRPAITLTAWGERRFDVLSDDRLRLLNSKLRIAERAYDGFSALMTHWMPGVDAPHDSQAQIQVVAPIPFDMRYDESGVLRVLGPTDNTVDLRATIFYRPRGIEKFQLTRSPYNSEGVNPGVALWEAIVPWPTDSVRAKIVLFLGESEMDSLEVTRWPSSASLLACVNIFFDPEHKRLHKAVLTAKPNEGFEFGMVRLLNLLGIPAIWYGQAATQGRPDLVALVEKHSRKLVVLGECTRERPDAKFSGLAQRARELHEHLSGQVAILPVVFTLAHITDSEIDKAIEHNVSLIGHAQLETLFEFLEAGADLIEVLNFLQTMRSDNSPTAYLVGLIPRT
jgi:hypothetical protein